LDDAEDFQLLEIRVDIGDISVDEAGGFPHALRLPLGDWLDEL
jgi:hypothetical protein